MALAPYPSKSTVPATYNSNKSFTELYRPITERMMFKKFLVVVVAAAVVSVNLTPASACNRCRQKSCRSGEVCCRNTTSNVGRRDFVVEDDLLSGLASEIHKRKTRSLTTSRDLDSATKEDEALSKLETKYRNFLPADDKLAAERAINAKGPSDRNVALLAGLAFQVLNLIKSKPDIGNTKTQSEILALVEDVAKDIESLKQEQKAKTSQGKKKCNVLTGVCEENDSANGQDDSSPAGGPSKTQSSPEAQIAQGLNRLTEVLAELSKNADSARKAVEEAEAKRAKDTEIFKKNLEIIKALQNAIVDPKKSAEPEAAVRSRSSTNRTPEKAVESELSDERIEK